MTADVGFQESQDEPDRVEDATARGRTISEKQLAANRENSKKATGPKTANGKRTVSQNATKHGIFARRGSSQSKTGPMPTTQRSSTSR